VSINNSATLVANLPKASGQYAITCPPGNFAPGTSSHNTSTTSPTCAYVSYPFLYENVIYNNSPYYVAVGQLSAQFQQNIITLFNGFTTTQAPTAPTADSINGTAFNGVTYGNGEIITGGTGACLSRAFWDIGVRGDTDPNSPKTTINGAPLRLNPQWSMLTPGVTGYASNNLTPATNMPQFQSQYCNGSRQPPEACASSSGGNNNGGCGWAVPPGIADATVPNPIFNLTPVATVDEGNNWINMRWGPLSLTNPSVLANGNYGGGAPLGFYALAETSQAIDHIPWSGNMSVLPILAQDGTVSLPSGGAPGIAIVPLVRFDYFGNQRADTPTAGRPCGAQQCVNVGAVEHP
jgi:hypothetical protein